GNPSTGEDHHGKERAHDWNQVVHLAVVFRGNRSVQLALPIQHVIGLGDSNAAPFKHRLCIVGQGVLGELPSKGAGGGTERRHYFEAAGFLVKMANSHPLIAFGLQIQEELHWLAESPARVSQRCIYLAALHTRCDFYKVVLEVLLENSSYFDELCIA